MIFYIIIFSIVLILFRKHSRYANIGCLILILVSCIRWDIGNDYFSYYLSAQNNIYQLKALEPINIIKQSLQEPSYVLLSFVFSPLPKAPIWIIGFYSIMNITIWYHVLKRINGLFWGFYVIFFMCFLFNSYDQIRQALSMSVFLYSYYYIQKGDFKRFFLLYLISVFIHYSAFVLFPFYLTKYIKTNGYVYTIIICILLYGFMTDIWSSFFEPLFLLTSYADYTESGKWLETQEFSTGLGATCWVIINYIIIMLSYKRYPIIANIIFIGICIYLFGSGNHLIERVSRYGTQFCIIGMPLIMNAKNSTSIITVSKHLIILLMTIYGLRTTYGGGIGCVPYDSIFSSNCINEKFRPREGRWN